MNQETNRVAQIIATAADKHLGVRPDGQPKPHDKSAAEAIEAEYLLIRRSELPATGYIERFGETHVDVEGSEAGTWPVTGSAATSRRWGLEYLAASEAVTYWHSKQAVIKRNLDKRRDELAVDYFEGVYEHLERGGYRRAIDQIIELEKRSS